MNTEYRPYLFRLIVIFFISLGMMLVITEGAFLLQRDETDRAPKTIQLVIPEGTSQSIEAGEDVISFPEGSVFVLGDVLEVVNYDTVNHQLGPIWVPPGAVGSLVLDEANEYSYTCSFVPSQYLGFDVRQPTTWTTRLVGLGISVPTTTAFLFLYSFLVFPLKKKDQLNGLEQSA